MNKILLLCFNVADLLLMDKATEEEADSGRERHCDSLIMCIITTLNEGLRNGGGIGDVLRKPSSSVSLQYSCPKIDRCLSKAI